MFVALLVSIPVAVNKAIQPPQRVSEVLIAPRPVPPPEPVKIKAPKPILSPPPRVKPKPFEAKILPPKIEPPKVEPRRIEAPKIEPPKIEPPKIEATRVPEPKFDLPAPAPKPKPEVKTNVFAAGEPAPMGPKPPARDVKMGGFGDPNGVPASATSTGKGLTVAKVGSFDLPAGSGQGGAGGKGRVVASAGFGDGGGGTASGSGAGGSGHGSVRSSGFSDYQAPREQAKVVKVATPVETPVEITFKPKPVYTEEARQRKVEGEVQLDVIFRASGQIQVLRVVRGLGLGLDESARAAAQQIHFKPGTRDGSPVDTRGIVHIVFALS
ncbi:MAG TPA: energy transducer TonB [Bryobacteraceae bacterium]|nr:energy transducer TonB [Bryobacteraceae bacterium]